MIEVLNSEQNFSAADKKFISKIERRITMDGQLSHTLPRSIIADIIIDSAKHFYKYYYKAKQDIDYRLSRTEIKTFLETTTNPNYSGRVGNVALLPPYVVTIKKIYELNAASIASDPYYGISMRPVRPYRGAYAYTNGINAEMYSIETVAVLNDIAVSKTLFGKSIPHSFNPLTHELVFFADMPNDVVLRCTCHIAMELLYEDALFWRHVYAKCKEELKRKIGGKTVTLAGGATINVEEICNNIEDAGTVEDIIKASNNTGDIILKRR